MHLKAKQLLLMSEIYLIQKMSYFIVLIKFQKLFSEKMRGDIFDS